MFCAALVFLVAGCSSYEAMHVSGTEPEAKLNDVPLPAAVLEERIGEIDKSYEEPRTVYRSPTRSAPRKIPYLPVMVISRSGAVYGPVHGLP